LKLFRQEKKTLSPALVLEERKRFLPPPLASKNKKLPKITSERAREHRVLEVPLRHPVPVAGLPAVLLVVVVVGVAALLGGDGRLLKRQDRHADLAVPQLLQDPRGPGRLVVLGPVAPLGQLLRDQERGGRDVERPLGAKLLHEGLGERVLPGQRLQPRDAARALPRLRLPLDVGAALLRRVPDVPLGPFVERALQQGGLGAPDRVAERLLEEHGLAAVEGERLGDPADRAGLGPRVGDQRARGGELLGELVLELGLERGPEGGDLFRFFFFFFFERRREKGVGKGERREKARTCVSSRGQPKPPRALLRAWKSSTGRKEKKTAAAVAAAAKEGEKEVERGGEGEVERGEVEVRPDEPCSRVERRSLLRAAAPELYAAQGRDSGGGMLRVPGPLSAKKWEDCRKEKRRRRGACRC